MYNSAQTQTCAPHRPPFALCDASDFRNDVDKGLIVLGVDMFHTLYGYRQSSTKLIIWGLVGEELRSCRTIYSFPWHKFIPSQTPFFLISDFFVKSGRRSKSIRHALKTFCLVRSKAMHMPGHGISAQADYCCAPHSMLIICYQLADIFTLLNNGLHNPFAKPANNLSFRDKPFKVLLNFIVWNVPISSIGVGWHWTSEHELPLIGYPSVPWLQHGLFSIAYVFFDLIVEPPPYIKESYL
jgi:hypothetical protein